jgi:hypothetical protein
MPSRRPKPIECNRVNPIGKTTPVVVDAANLELLKRSRLPRKEVIQPQVPLRLPCYDFTPITTQTLGRSLRLVGSRTSGSSSFRGVTGGVYKARERIHRGMLIRDY